MDLFETTSTLGEDTFRELKKYLMPQVQRAMMYIFAALGLCAAVTALWLRAYPVAVGMAVFVVVIAAEYILGLNNYVKLNTKRLRETANAGQCEYTTSFDGTGFKLYNHASGGTFTLAYDNIRRFKETANYYVLFTGANQFGVVNKSQLEAAGQREALLAHLKSMCKNIRW